jgi:uncharacterized membrane protein (DUF106 family)
MNLLDNPMWFIMIIAAVLAAIMAIVNKVLVDQDRVKEIQTEMKAHNKKLMKASREKNQEELEKLNRDKPRIAQMQQELMKMQMPMFASMLPFFVVFYVLRSVANAQDWGQFMALPWDDIFALPLFGRKLSWLGWYIFCSLPFTSFFRKILGVR